MSSPIRPFLNLLAFASIAGVLFWREHVWQTRLQQAPASHPAPALPKEVTTDLPAESMALRAEGEVLRKKLTDTESRLSTLTAEVQNLKKAAEAAKPPPTPGDLAQQLKTQRGLAFDPEPTWEPVAMDAILEKIKTQVEAQLPLPVAEARSRAAVAMGFTRRFSTILPQPSVSPKCPMADFMTPGQSASTTARNLPLSVPMAARHSSADSPPPSLP